MLLFCRSDIDPDNIAHEPNARRLFEAMLIALQEVSYLHILQYVTLFYYS